MKNLWLLTKINLLTFFDINKFKNKNSKEKVRGVGYGLIMIYAVAAIIYLVYQYASTTMQGYKIMNIEYILPSQFMCITSMFILFTSIYKINGTLFGFKDYDLLMSLPIKKWVILVSKILVLYAINLLITFFIMIPVLVVYVTNISVSFTFYIIYILTLLVIPLVPIIVASFIGFIITFIASKFKAKTFINILLTVGFFIGYMFVMSKMETVTSIELANIGETLVSTFNKIYPLTSIYTEIIKEYDVISLLIYLLIPLILFTVFVIIMNNQFKTINDNINNQATKSNYKLTKLKTKSPIMALYIKELKRYFSSSLYILNTGIGVILLTIIIIGSIVFNNEMIDSFIGIPGLSEMIYTISPLIISAFCVISCTTSCSISLEGKSFWIIKSLPVSPMKIFISKILVNLTILVPAILINSIILVIYLKANIASLLMMIILPVLYAVFIAIAGIILNLHFPLFDWKSETKPIKQSSATLLAMIVGMIAIGIPIFIIFKYNISNMEMFIVFTSISIFIIDVLLYLYMKVSGTKIFNKINA